MKYFIGIMDATEFEIKAAKPLPSLALPLEHFSLILAVFSHWRAGVSVNGNPPPENECNICSLAEQACPIASTKHSNFPERRTRCQVLPFYQFPRVWQCALAGLGEEN